jgi:hypothetical protein
MTGNLLRKEPYIRKMEASKDTHGYQVLNSEGKQVSRYWAVQASNGFDVYRLELEEFHSFGKLPRAIKVDHFPDSRDADKYMRSNVSLDSVNLRSLPVFGDKKR